MECKLCNYTATTKNNFMRHCKIASHITLEKYYKICMLCDKKYSSLNSYNNHKRTYHPENDNTDKTDNKKKVKIITRTVTKTITKTILKKNLSEKTDENYVIPDIIEYIEDIDDNLPKKISENNNTNITSNFDNLLPKKKIRIPAVVRKIVWATYIGKNATCSKCLCCDLEEISYTNFECGHIISEKNGGKPTVDNLRPICG